MKNVTVDPNRDDHKPPNPAAMNYSDLSSAGQSLGKARPHAETFAKEKDMLLSLSREAA